MAIGIEPRAPDGMGTRDIAEALHLSVKTIESYYAHIKTKLNLQNAREMLQFAIVPLAL